MAAKSYDMANYELADIGTRFAAWFIDGAILALVESIAFVGAREVGMGAGFIFGLVYAWYFLTRNQGQTPAKCS